MKINKLDTAVANVATVPQRSPFRYPGGKTWLVPYIRQWLIGRVKVNCLIEPFAGGGVVSLTAVCEDLVKSAVLFEKDEHIASVWRTILNGDAHWLADRITDFEMSQDNVERTLTGECAHLHDSAFATILRNRVQRGGIMAPGAGLMKSGENGRGLLSRWYPETLKRRILAIYEARGRLSFVEGDGLLGIDQYARCEDVAFFIDPPYTVAGKRLYAHSAIDHVRLFDMASKVAGDVLMTYDHAEEICTLARRFGFQMMLIPMKSTHHAIKYELLIGNNLNWLNVSPVHAAPFRAQRTSPDRQESPPSQQQSALFPLP